MPMTTTDVLNQSCSPLRRLTGLIALAALAGCGLVPEGGPRVVPNEAAIVSSETNGAAFVVTYDVTLMNRPEAEVYAQQVCEETDRTLEVVRHPAPAPGPTSSVIFTCRRPLT